MKRYLLRLAAVAGALLGAGCLVDRTTHSLYLSPDGTLAWTVLQEDIRSNETDPSKRMLEEQEFLEKLARGANPIAEALGVLGGEAIRTRCLRMERPYAVLTEARFARVDYAIGRFIAALGGFGYATLETDSGVSTLTIVVDVESSRENDTPSASPAEALIENIADYRFVLTDGRFVDASGFRIIEDGMVAQFLDIPEQELEQNNGVATWQLRWKVDPDRK